MWRFIDGVSQPKKTKLERKDYHDNYDKTKRQRKFLTAWTINREWLADSEKGMICTYCKQIPTCTTGSRLFVTGCTSYKLDSVTKHENSLQHKYAVQVNEGKSKPVDESEAGKIISTLNKENFEKLEKMFRNCHALIKNNRPLSDFTWMCDLDGMKGFDLGRTYRNINSAKVFIQSIADVEFQKIANQIKDTKFLSVIGDGSTDSAVKEQEMWFIRGCRAGIVTVDFIGVHSANKATAENIVHGLQETVVSNLKMDWSQISNKLVGLSCDGASVMTGCKSGVRAILEKDCPSIVTIHCMAHRLELSLKDVTKKVKTYERVNILLAGLYYFYHNSALNRAVLQKTYEATKSQDEKLLIPTRVGGTRWIGHQVTAILHVITSYKFIITHMEQLLETRERVSSDAKAKSKGFLKLLKSKVIVGFLLFLLDVLAPLRHLSLNLQDRTALISCQHDSLESALEAVRKSKT